MSRGKLLNIGPKSSAWLRQVGIHTEQDLRETGAVEAFLKVKRASFRPSLNLLYAIEGALQGCHWQQVPSERRAELLLLVDAAEALQAQPKLGGKVREIDIEDYAAEQLSESHDQNDDDADQAEADNGIRFD
ncbi:TfoX/Sxy family protein [Pseudomarimonas arenosa]|uniref:TfoX/Sxy family protein n=1 Tax=Pseudomarimonas arenosa TaxID=2774145 RepID=A0AAW3ZJU7_9GAMM|nr:TfoX/Sxy family protein [Pseudomarimonas arenosa]MBD8525205.1 TfoX/Sxy family protein [Pseudomarimonas arenosa]